MCGRKDVREKCFLKKKMATKRDLIIIFGSIVEFIFIIKYFIKQYIPS